MSETTGGVGKQ